MKSLRDKHPKRPYWPSGRRFHASWRRPMPEECSSPLLSNRSRGILEADHEHADGPARCGVSSNCWFPRYRHVSCNAPGRLRSLLHDDAMRCDVAWRCDPTDNRCVSSLPDTDHSDHTHHTLRPSGRFHRWRNRHQLEYHMSEHTGPAVE